MQTEELETLKGDTRHAWRCVAGIMSTEWRLISSQLPGTEYDRQIRQLNSKHQKTTERMFHWNVLWNGMYYNELYCIPIDIKSVKYFRLTTVPSARTTQL